MKFKPLKELTCQMVLLLLICWQIVGLPWRRFLEPRDRKHNVHCSLWVRVDCESNEIPVPPITAGSVTLQLIWEAVINKGYRKRGSHAEGQLPHSLNPSQFAWKQKDGGKSKIKTSEDQWRTRKHKSTKNGTYKMRPEGLTLALRKSYISSGGVAPPTCLVKGI